METPVNKEPASSVGISFDIMLLPLQDLGSIAPSLSFPVHKMGRNVLTIPETAYHQLIACRWDFPFSLFLCCVPQSGGPLLPW